MTTLSLASFLSSATLADSPVQGLIPVPKTGASIAPTSTHTRAVPNSSGANLSWRRSDRGQPAPNNDSANLGRIVAANEPSSITIKTPPATLQPVTIAANELRAPEPRPAATPEPTLAASPQPTPTAPASTGRTVQWLSTEEFSSPSVVHVGGPRSTTQPNRVALVPATPDRPLAAQTSVFDEPPSTLMQVGHTGLSESASIAQAAWAHPQLGMPQNAPVPAAEPNQFELPIPEEEPNMFENPFNDEPEDAPGVNGLRNGETLPAPNLELPSPQPPATPQPNAVPQPKMAPQPNAAPPSSASPSLRDMLKNETPESETPESSGKIESPSDKDDVYSNPFGNRPLGDTLDERTREQLDNPRQSPRFDSADEMKLRSAISCDDFRRRIAGQTIMDVSLDISPPFRPDVIEEDEFQRLKSRFDERQESRQWRTIDGQPIAQGRLVDLAYEKVLVQTDDGTTQELAINRLSEADLAFISDNWGLPSECLIEQVAYQPRTWTQTTMTWKASNLCHKPLYFEEVNLERYGHTAGPVLQPVISSAHFFANIAVLPYKMGIHPPGECQYALGYYRPGNCAPWIIPPVPISLRGGLTQAAVMTGAFWLIP